MPLWVVQSFALPPPPGYDCDTLTVNATSIGSAYGPYPDAAEAHEQFDRISRLNVINVPWSVVRIVEAESRSEAMQKVENELLNARRAAFGVLSVEEEWAQAREAFGRPLLQEAMQLIAALEANGIPVKLLPHRAARYVAVARIIRLPGGGWMQIDEYDDEQLAEQTAVHFARQVAKHATSRLQAFRSGKLVVTVADTTNAEAAKVAATVLGPALQAN